MPRHPVTIPALALATVACAALLLAGPLDPPSGPVSPTYKTLSEVEPRTAINSTNTRGDADSVYKLSRSGAYYLTGNITGVSGKHGIEIAADNVSIDLMGFEIVGVPGSLNGISSDGPRDHISIRNGVVRDFGGLGVAVSSNGQVGVGGLLADLLVSGNGGIGVFANSSSTVRDCVSQNNAGSGFTADQGVIFRACVATENGFVGFYASTDATLTGCIGDGNDGGGFVVLSASNITDCAATNNGGDGFSIVGGVTVSRCNASSNSGHGIGAYAQNTIVDNLCASNGLGAGSGAGIRIFGGAGNRIEGNNCSFADWGISVQGAGSIITRNTCSSNTTNWSIAPGNAVAPIVSASTNVGAINGNTYSGGLGSTDPNANFTY